MIKELPNNCTGVKLPNGATDVDIFQDRIDQFVIGIDRGGQSFHIPLPPGSYTLLFCTKEKVTEEQVREVVEADSSDHYIGYKNYPFRDGVFISAIESYHSLLRSLNMEGNWAVFKRK